MKIELITVLWLCLSCSTIFSVKELNENKNSTSDICKQKKKCHSHIFVCKIKLNFPSEIIRHNLNLNENETRTPSTKLKALDTFAVNSAVCAMKNKIFSIFRVPRHLT